MPTILAGIRLKDFCGFRDLKLNFLDEQYEPRKILAMHGPNGCGKSSLITAILLVSNPFLQFGRDTRLAFRKYTYNPDYNPVYGLINTKTGEAFQAQIDMDTLKESYEALVNNQSREYIMEIEGIFDQNGDLKSSYLTTDGIVTEKTTLPKKSKGYAYYIDADNPTFLTKFQIDATQAEVFMDIAEAVYGYPCSLLEPIKESIPDADGERIPVEIHTDFMLHKNIRGGDTTVHYRSMSAGEKKIATLLAFLCNISYMKEMDVVLIDNIDLHVYYTRHAILIDKLLLHFPQKQFIVTTHSGTLIHHVREKYGQECILAVDQL